MTGGGDDTSDMTGHAEDDSAWDAEPRPVREFVAGLRGFADTDAPAAPLELEAVFAGVLRAVPRARRRIGIGSVLAGAALASTLVAAVLSAVDALPAPAQHMVSAVVSGLRPLHLVPAGTRPSEPPADVPGRQARPPLTERIGELASLVATAPRRVAAPQDLPVGRRARPTHPAHPMHPAHPARPAHAAKRGHPSHPVHPAHPAHPFWAHGPR